MTLAAETHLDPASRYGLIALAIVQGYALYFLHLALDQTVWPATDVSWLKALYTAAIGLPVFFYLGMERLKDRRNLYAGAVLGVLLLFLGWYLGWVEEGASTLKRNRHPFTTAFVVSVGVALFISSMLFRTWTTSATLRFHYDRMLSLSWQNALTIGQLGLFVGVFWLLLFLWGGLFAAIGIDFFKELFNSLAFVYPVTWLVIGLGLVLIRDRIRLIATVQFMCEALIKALLPLAAAITLLFLATLPITGVQPVWDTGRAAALMMALTVVLLFFFNAVLVDSAEGYRPALRRFVMVAVASLPISTLLAAWALWLRIDQYGLTLDRLWAATILLLIAGFSFSYAALVIWRRDASLAPIRSANRWLALLVVCVLVAVNTPLADLRKWAAHSQVSRLLDGRTSPIEFDYVYLRFDLGAYGTRALDRLESSELAQSEPEIARRVAAIRKQEHRWSIEPEVDINDMEAVASMLRSSEPLPDALLREIARNQKECLKSKADCQAVQPTFKSDQIREVDWLVYQHEHRIFGSAYKRIDETWSLIGTFGSSCTPDAERDRPLSPERIGGPFLAYRDGECFYTVTPTSAHLKRLARGAGQAD